MRCGGGGPRCNTVSLLGAATPLLLTPYSSLPPLLYCHPPPPLPVRARSKSEYDLMHNLYFKAAGCSRHYFLLWYRAYQRAGLRLPAPHWDGPPVPGHNTTHDTFVYAWRAANGVRGNFG